jgi:hypothetical protein
MSTNSEVNVFGTSHYVRPLYLYSSDLSEVNVFGTSHYVRPLYLYSSELSEVNVLILVTIDLTQF